MTIEAVLGLDAGTTSTKAVVVDADGTVLSAASSDPIATLAPQPGAAEQDPATLIDAVGEATGRALLGLPGRVRITTVAIAAQSGSVMPVDAEDAPLGNLVTWMDARAASIVDAWSVAERNLVRSTSGWGPSSGLGLASVCWFRSNRPEVHAAAARWASVDDHLIHVLTGSWRTNASNAAGMQFMDVNSLQWDDRLCDLAGIRSDQLSPIDTAARIVGVIGDGAGRSTMLEPDTPVAIGGHDQACAALGLGATSPGAVVMSAGTAWVLTAITDPTPVDRLPPELNLSPHVVPGVWSASCNLGGLGAVLDWWRRQAHGPDPDPGLLEADLALAGPDGPFFVPDLSDDTPTRSGRFTAEEAGHGRAERTRAVLEAAAFEVRRALEPMAEAVTTPRSLTLVGGGSRNRGLRQLLADTTGLPIVAPPDASWPALGAAALAASALGWPIPDHVSGSSDPTEPETTAAETLDERFETYLRLVEGGSR